MDSADMHSHDALTLVIVLGAFLSLAALMGNAVIIGATVESLRVCATSSDCAANVQCCIQESNTGVCSNFCDDHIFESRGIRAVWFSQPEPSNSHLVLLGVAAFLLAFVVFRQKYFYH